MKRRNFLKTLLAAPAIPLVGKAVPVTVSELLPEPTPNPHFTVTDWPASTTAPSPFTYTVTNVSEGDGTCVIEMGPRFQTKVDHD